MDAKEYLGQSMMMGVFALTKEELRNYLRMGAELRRLEEKMEELRARLESPQAAPMDGMPKGGGRRGFADRIGDLAELRELYGERWDALIGERRRVEGAIALLADPAERAVLGYRYVDGLAWERICVKISYSWRQVHRLHANALKSIEKF